MEIGKKGRNKKWISWFFGCLVILLLAGILVQVRQRTGGSEETAAYAGDYGRGTKRYKEFKAYVKKNAVSSEKINDSDKELSSDKDAVVYTLDSEAVKKWGEPCNDNRFPMKKEEFLKHLEKKGYAFVQISENEKNTVEVQKYGAVKTSFLKREDYRIAEGVGMLLVSDLINEDVLLVNIYREAGYRAEIAEQSADAFLILSKTCEDREELVQAFHESLQKVIQGESDWLGEQSNDCAAVIAKDEDGQERINIIPAESVEGVPYYWP